ncbi:MAG: WG repeat-containing protein [Bacteroidota bacterium]
MLEFLKKLFGSQKEDSGVYIPPAYTPSKKSKSTDIDELMTSTAPVFVDENSEILNIGINQAFEKQNTDTVKRRSNYTIEEEWEIYEENGLHGYKDEKGDVIIKPKFIDADYFKHGYAIVEMKTGKGMINNKGEFILEPLYDFIYDDVNGFLQINKDNLYGLAKTDGTIAVPVHYNDTGELWEGLVWVERNDFVGYVDENHKTVIDFKFDWCGNFSEGLASATQYGQVEGQKDIYGYIDKTGNFVIQFDDYDEGGEFKEGLAPVSVDSKFGYINKQGKFIGERIYHSAGSFVNGLSCVQLEDGGKWGYADKTGKLVIPCQFESTSDYIDDPDELHEFITGLKKQFLTKHK